VPAYFASGSDGFESAFRALADAVIAALFAESLRACTHFQAPSQSNLAPM